MRIASATLVAVLALSASVPAFAQATGTSSSRQRSPSTAKPSTPMPKPKMNIRAFGAFDVEWMSASDTFKAVTGSSTMIGYGGGAEVVNLWKHLFVRGAFTYQAADGERAFVIGGDVIPTGVPMTVKMQTTELSGGWRLPMRKHPKYTPYGGGSVLFVHYSESSDFETSTDAVSESFTGYAVLGGLDIQAAKRVYVTLEGQYRFVPNALGDAGVSAVYGEKDLGGFVFRAMVGYNLKK